MNVYEITKHVLDENSFYEMKDALNSNKRQGLFKYCSTNDEGIQASTHEFTIKIGVASIAGIKCMVCINDSEFMGGTIGPAEGERIGKAFDVAYKRNIPIICFLNSGGARIQDGLLALVQMPKIISAMQKYKKKSVPLISIICNYVYGGVFASIVGVSDIVIMDRKSRLGFSGKRIIETTYNKKLSENFQSSTFALENGLVDMVVDEMDLRNTLHQLLKLHKG